MTKSITSFIYKFFPSALQQFIATHSCKLTESMGSVAGNVDGHTSPPHVVLFPFMSKGHTIPLLHFARLLLRRHISITVITTAANHPFISQTLPDTAVSIIDLPFPDKIPDIPTGIESTHKLPSISLFYKFAMATQHMQPHFEQVLESLPRVSFMVSDGFLWWTLESATKFEIPRFGFYGTSNYCSTVGTEAFVSGILNGPQPDDELVTLNHFPQIRICKNDFDSSFTKPDLTSSSFEVHVKMHDAICKSYGMIVNSFYELEPVYTDYVNKNCPPYKSLCVGPLGLGEQPLKSYSEAREKPSWIRWLDQKLEEKHPVLYVAFGSQAEVSAEQVMELAAGLEESMANFMWVIPKKEWVLPDGYEEIVKNRGIAVKEWVDQREILMHESVKGFLSHCGWNSVLESISAGVPILAWPLMADQPLNARMVVEEIKVGLRVETCDGSVRGFVKKEGLVKMVKELIEGEKGEEVRRKVKEMAAAATKAVEEGGSSWRTLESLMDETCGKKKEICAV